MMSVEEVRKAVPTVDEAVMCDVRDAVFRRLFDLEGEKHRMVELRKLVADDDVKAVLDSYITELELSKSCMFNVMAKCWRQPPLTRWLIGVGDFTEYEVEAVEPCDAYREWSRMQCEEKMSDDYRWVESIEELGPAEEEE